MCFSTDIAEMLASACRLAITWQNTCVDGDHSVPSSLRESLRAHAATMLRIIDEIQDEWEALERGEPVYSGPRARTDPTGAM